MSAAACMGSCLSCNGGGRLFRGGRHRWSNVCLQPHGHGIPQQALTVPVLQAVSIAKTQLQCGSLGTPCKHSAAVTVSAVASLLSGTIASF